MNIMECIDDLFLDSELKIFNKFECGNKKELNLSLFTCISSNSYSLPSNINCTEARVDSTPTISTVVQLTTYENGETYHRNETLPSNITFTEARTDSTPTIPTIVQPTPCENGGKYHPNDTLPRKFWCECVSGFHGTYCEDDTRACQPNTCL